jgi:hypothetical protein
LIKPQANKVKSRLMKIANATVEEKFASFYRTQSKLMQRHTQDFTPMLNSMQSKSMQQHYYKVLESFDGAVITRDGELMHCAHNTSQQLSYARIVISRSVSESVFSAQKPRAGDQSSSTPRNARALDSSLHTEEEKPTGRKRE